MMSRCRHTQIASLIEQLRRANEETARHMESKDETGNRIADLLNQVQMDALHMDTMQATFTAQKLSLETALVSATNESAGLREEVETLSQERRDLEQLVADFRTQLQASPAEVEDMGLHKSDLMQEIVTLREELEEMSEEVAASAGERDLAVEEARRFQEQLLITIARKEGLESEVESLQADLDSERV